MNKNLSIVSESTFEEEFYFGLKIEFKHEGQVFSVQSRIRKTIAIQQRDLSLVFSEMKQLSEKKIEKMAQTGVFKSEDFEFRINLC